MLKMTSTHTYAILEVSAAAYNEIRSLLAAGGYSDQFHKDKTHDEVIDMHGIALAIKPDEAKQAANLAEVQPTLEGRVNVAEPVGKGSK
jgi:hypothetical protein